ncbi:MULTISPECIES: hypothetical protein [Arthrospira]|nr:hypothetical protein [Arthrospira platensis]MDT9183697.1 hypothetical protein [Limnospira sp. PMC 289.06]MDT9293899.1 hypothetical protein [Arthrospira platensis PCC 7345]MDT9309475.1 hypothetical protein [Limnospira sp. Paracas R14]
MRTLSDLIVPELGSVPVGLGRGGEARRPITGRARGINAKS